MGSKGTVLILLLILGSMIVILPNVKPVKAEGPIIIRSNGSISGTDKIQREGDFYYLTDNIEIFSPRFGDSGISIQKDNIVIDGKNFSISEKNDTHSTGVDMTGRFNVTIQNLKIKHFSTGIIFGSFSDKLGKEAHSSNNTIIGNTITGFWISIWISASSSGNKIIDNKIIAGDEGIVIYYSDNNYLSGNVITGNRVGLSIEGAENNVLRNNRMYDNEENLEILHVSSSFIQDIDTSNTVNNKPIYYWINQHDKTIPSDAGFVALGNCSGITVQNLNIKNNGVGILLYSTRDSVITNNRLENNGAGITMIISQGINVIDNNLIGNQEGIEVHGSSDTTISKNSIVNSRSGIALGASNNVSMVTNSITGSTLLSVFIRGGERNVVSGNNFTDNDVWCVYLLDTNHNIIVANSFTENSGFAIRWSNSYNNTFYHNNFINNARGYEKGLQVSNPWFLGSGDHEYNTWDNGVEGNYWSDYTSRYHNATEVNDSGIWAVPFFINEVNIDRFPLTEPVDIELATKLLLQPPDTCTSSPENTILTVIVIIAVVGAVFLAYFLKIKKIAKPE